MSITNSRPTAAQVLRFDRSRDKSPPSADRWDMISRSGSCRCRHARAITTSSMSRTASRVMRYSCLHRCPYGYRSPLDDKVKVERGDHYTRDFK